jgi:hypothetical protein
MTYRDLQKKLHDKPFRSFRIRLVNNTVYDILEPWMIIIGESSAVIVTQVRRDDQGYETAMDWRTISIAHIIELSDIQSKERDRKRKPA